MQDLCKILIIDDENILRHGLKHLCNWEEEGFCIVGEATNGKQALQMIEEVKPHIIITDVVMPVMDGVEFSKIANKLYPNIKIIVLSSFSEFDYVKEAFKHGVCDYLLKAKLTSPELLKILKKLRTEINYNKEDKPQSEDDVDANSILFSFMREYPSKETPDFDYLKKHFVNQYFIMIACNLDFIDNTQNTSRDIFKNNVSKLTQHYFSSYIYSNIFLDNKYFLIINFNDDLSIDIDINQFTHNLRNSLSSSVFISSHHFMEIENILDVYAQIISLLPKTFYFGDRHCISINALLKSRKSPAFNLDLFTSHTKNLDFESAYDILKVYFNDVRESLSLDDYSLKRFCQNIIYDTLNTCDALGFDISEINSSKIRLFKSIDLAFSAQNLEEIVFNILNQIADSINQQADQKNSIMINQIKRYVDENYSSDISLTDISNALHINYHYVSSYFKTHTNENLSTYINKVRIEKAKSLLQDKTIPISHISEMVGFSEHNYFSKVFKKYTNVTPTTYRRKVLKQ